MSDSAVLWTVACQGPLCMEISRQECWSGLPFPFPGDFPNWGFEPGSAALQADSTVWASKEQGSYNFLAESPSIVILEPPEIKSVTVSIFPPSLCGEVMGLDAMILVFECWVLSQAFCTPLLPSSRGSLVSLHFLPLVWCHLHIWGYWYFSWQSWFQLMICAAWHFTWCTLHVC